MTRAPEPPLAELAIPPANAVCASGCAAGCLLALVGTFVALALDNLAAGADVPLVGHVASALWLALVALVLGVSLRAAGLRGAVVACLGPFSKRHFIDLRADGDARLLGFGYALFGRRWYYLLLNARQVVSVTMGTGQASALAGRDLSDWSVVLHYRDPAHEPPVIAGRTIYEVHLIGPARDRGCTAELFAAVVEFLRAAGIALRPGASDTEFCAPPVDRI